MSTRAVDEEAGTTPGARPRKPDPRRARTRAALVAAGTRLLAEGRTAVSVQEITEAAGVGLGSFYNHFESKEALFESAVAEALDTWGVMRDVVVEGLEDPAEVFATSFRMIGRVQRELPEMVRVLLNEGASVLLTDRGLRPRALTDLQRGIDEGRFSLPSGEMALMLVGGALLGLMQMLEADPSLDDAAVSDVYTRHVLLALGVAPDEADRLVGLSLPEIDLPT